MCLPIFKSAPLQPILSGSGVDLRDFRPQPIIDDNRKIIGYKSKTYAVKVAMHDSCFDREDKMKDIALRVLAKFPAQLEVFTYVYTFQLKPGVSHFHCTPFDFEIAQCFRVIKGQDGKISTQQVSEESYKESYKDGDPEEKELRSRGFAKLDLIFHRGNFEVMRSKKKETDLIKLDRIDLNKF